MEQLNDSKLGKEYIKAIYWLYMSPYFLNLYAECIMQNARLDGSQTGIKITGRNINKVRYADDITLMAGSEEELKNLLMWVRRRVKNLA